MNREEIMKAIHVLIMVTGYCPKERDIGNEDGSTCGAYNNCVDCWKHELSNELKKLEKEEILEIEKHLYKDAD